MKYNLDWVYRELMSFDLLINIRNNSILKIDKKLGELLSRQNLSFQAIELWKEKNNICDNEWNSCLDLLQKKGIIYE